MTGSQIQNVVGSIKQEVHNKALVRTRLTPRSLAIMRLENSMSRVLKIMKWFAISSAVLLVLLLLFWKPILHFVFHDLPFTGKSFDRTVWSSALSCKNDQDCLDKEMACLRGPMYRDLEKNLLTMGTPKTTVTGLLGEPTQSAKNNCFDYELGYCSGLKIDTDYLRVCFDSNEKITNVYHWQS